MMKSTLYLYQEKFYTYFPLFNIYYLITVAAWLHIINFLLDLNILTFTVFFHHIFKIYNLVFMLYHSTNSPFTTEKINTKFLFSLFFVFIQSYSNLFCS